MANTKSKEQALWTAALKDAAGPLSQYLAPSRFNLSLIPVEAEATDESSEFYRAIIDRLDLARARSIRKAVQLASSPQSYSYRHDVVYNQSQLRGKLHVPEYVRARAAGLPRGVPAIRTQKALSTPENHLVTEAIQWGLTTTQKWSSSPGAAGSFAEEEASALRREEAKSPWAELRHQPSYSITRLLQIVEHRLSSGIASAAHPAADIVALFRTEYGSELALTEAASFLSTAIVDDPDFADRIFELLLLGWITASFETLYSIVDVNPETLQDSRKTPTVTASSKSGTDLKLYYQSSHALPGGHWKKRIGVSDYKPVAGVPDFCLTADSPSSTRTYLIDAKYRSWAGRSETMYKMLGYRDNFTMGNFVGVAIFPEFEETFRGEHYYESSDRVSIVKIPLTKGRTYITRLLASLH